MSLASFSGYILTIISLFVFQPSLNCSAEEITEASAVLKLAVQSISDIPSKATKKDQALKLIAVTQAKAGDVEGGLKSAALRHAVVDRLYSYGEIATVRIEEGDMKGAGQALDSISSEESFSLRFVFGPSSQVLATRAMVLRPIAQSFINSGQIKAAEEVVELMKPGLFGSVTYQSAALIEEALSDISTAQARAGDVGSAIKTAEALSNSFSQARAFARIAATQAETGDIRGALDTEALIPPAFSVNGPLPLVVNGLVRAGATNEAKALVKKHIEKALMIPNDAARSYTLRHLAGPQAIAGDVQGAMRTASMLSDKPQVMYGSDKDLALQAIALAQAQNKDFQGARETATSISGSLTRDGTLKELVFHTAQAGDSNGALEIAGQIQNVLIRDGALIALIMHLTEAHKHTDALEIAQSIHNLQNRAVAFSRIARFQARAKDVVSAKTIINMINGEEGKARALQDMVEDQAKAGDLNQAMSTVAAIQMEPYRSNALGYIAVAQAIEGDISSALQTVTSQHKGYRDGTLLTIVREYARRGDPKEALAWATARTTPYEKAFALVGVAENVIAH